MTDLLNEYIYSYNYTKYADQKKVNEIHNICKVECDKLSLTEIHSKNRLQVCQMYYFISEVSKLCSTTEDLHTKPN